MGIKKLLNFFIAVRRTEERADLGIINIVRDPSIIEQLMPREQSRAQSSPCITRGRLNPDIFKRAFSQNASISYAIERNTAC